MELLYVEFSYSLFKKLTKDAKNELLGIPMKEEITLVYNWGWGCVQSWSDSGF